MLYLQVYLTEVFVQVKVYLRNGQKMHLEFVHFLLEGLEWKNVESAPLGWLHQSENYCWWWVYSWRSQWWQFVCLFVCLVPGLRVGPTGCVGCVPKADGWVDGMAQSALYSNWELLKMPRHYWVNINVDLTSSDHCTSTSSLEWLIVQIWFPFSTKDPL